MSKPELIEWAALEMVRATLAARRHSAEAATSVSKGDFHIAGSLYQIAHAYGGMVENLRRLLRDHDESETIKRLRRQLADEKATVAATQNLNKALEEKYREALRERNLAAEASDQGTWIWSDTDLNDLGSLAAEALVTITAGQLRQLRQLTQINVAIPKYVQQWRSGLPGMKDPSLASAQERKAVLWGIRERAEYLNEPGYRRAAACLEWLATIPLAAFETKAQGADVVARDSADAAVLREWQGCRLGYEDPSGDWRTREAALARARIVEGLEAMAIGWKKEMGRDDDPHECADELLAALDAASLKSRPGV